MNKEDVFNKISQWEYENGESFTDYFGACVHIPNFMFWCLGKSYLTQAQFNDWERDFNTKEFDSRVLGSIVYGDPLTDISYTIGKRELEHNEDVYIKSHNILAEFISASKTYQERLNEFLYGD